MEEQKNKKSPKKSKCPSGEREQLIKDLKARLPKLKRANRLHRETIEEGWSLIKKIEDED